MIVSAICIFIVGHILSIVGIILAIISLIISIKNLKNKELLNKIALIGDIIIIAIWVLLFASAFSIVNNTLNSAKTDARKMEEEIIEYSCESNVMFMVNNKDVTN